MKIHASDFEDDFIWGVANSAYQTEGHNFNFGKGPSIWDTFTNKKLNKVENGIEATNFYTLYEEDIKTAKDLHLKAFRFSISWARIFPEGIGKVNKEGVAFYHRIIDCCKKNNLEPWLTLYHWDLPQSLEDKGGWTNRDILQWFSEYTEFCAKEYGDKVKHWIVLNEPMSFTGLGYFTGYHAPGKKGLHNFLRAAHHAALCQAYGGRIVRANVKNARIGTTFSCSVVKPKNKLVRHVKAARRVDALLNRLFIEPVLGLGYPIDNFPALQQIEKYILPGDMDALCFDFDFFGIQYYFRVVAKHSPFMPYLFAKEVPAHKRKAKVNNMNLEVYPKGMYKMLKQFSSYIGVKQLYISESGTCLNDVKIDGQVKDDTRVNYYKKTLKYVYKAKQKGFHIKGFFLWTLVDNFEWAEGYKARFGIVYNEFDTQNRTIKKSGYWLQSFLSNQKGIKSV